MTGQVVKGIDLNVYNSTFTVPFLQYVCCLQYVCYIEERI